MTDKRWGWVNIKDCKMEFGGRQTGEAETESRVEMSRTWMMRLAEAEAVEGQGVGSWA